VLISSRLFPLFYRKKEPTHWLHAWKPFWFCDQMKYLTAPTGIEHRQSSNFTVWIFAASVLSNLNTNHILSVHISSDSWHKLDQCVFIHFDIVCHMCIRRPHWIGYCKTNRYSVRIGVKLIGANTPDVEDKTSFLFELRYKREHKFNGRNEACWFSGDCMNSIPLEGAAIWYTLVSSS
jgi:hypothetical protein